MLGVIQGEDVYLNYLIGTAVQASGIVFESESEGLGRAESSKYHDKQRRAGGYT